MSTAAPYVGPVEWIAIAFPGAVLDPAVVPPLAELVNSGTVRVIDAAVVHKDPSGAITGTELENEEAALFDAVDGDVFELLSDDDLALIAADLQPDTTTLVLVWENRWAAEFVDTVRQANAEGPAARAVTNPKN